MFFVRFVSIFLLTIFFIPVFSYAQTNPQQHFRKVMIVMFENMSYTEIKQEPTFKKLVEYTGNILDQNGKLIPLLKSKSMQDSAGNGYAFFSNYYNNHSGGIEPTRPSQPNYIAMTSGSIQSIEDNDNYNLFVDNLANELNDAKIKWKVYAENLPDPKAASALILDKSNLSKGKITPFIRDPNKDEYENDLAEQRYLKEYKKAHHTSINDNEKTEFNLTSGCYIGSSYIDDGDPDDGYVRKHEPFISYMGIQSSYENCKNIVNGSHLFDDINNMPEVSLYIPNQINDGHNGTLEERTIRANTFLSKMMGTNPKTGEPLPDAANAPFQKFMAQDGLLIITFDEPSVTGNPDRTIYTIFAGKMINSGAYPNKEFQHAPICYPTKNKQTKLDKNGSYDTLQCNHYNLLKLIEKNWGLRGLNPQHTSAGYKYAFSLDNNIPILWKN